MINDYYDVVIVGAGPAGLFAANELKEEVKAQGRKVLVIEKGKDIEERHCPMEELETCQRCKQCDIMSGIGGAGTFSDGTLNLRPDIGGNLEDLCHDEDMAWQLVDFVDKIFIEHGAPDELYKGGKEEIEELKRRAASAGARFVEINQRHMGSDKTKGVIKNFKRDLVSNGVEFMIHTNVIDIIVEDEKGGKESKGCRSRCAGVITDKGEIRSEYTLLAPGRVGASWIEEIVNKHGIEAEYASIDVGVRVEVPAITMNPVTRINLDPKIHIWTKRYDDFARTFCLHPNEVIPYQKEGVLYVDKIKDISGDIKVLSIDLQNQNRDAFFIEPKYKTKRVYKGKIVRIKVRCGGEICVTEDHPLFVRDNISREEVEIVEVLKSKPQRSIEIAEVLSLHVALVRSKLARLLGYGNVTKYKEGKYVYYKWIKNPILEYKVKPAGEVKEGEVLPVLLNLPQPDRIIRSINLIEELKKIPEDFLNNIYVHGIKEQIKKLKNSGLTYSEINRKLLWNHDRLLFKDFVNIAEKYDVRDDNIWIYLKGSKQRIPAKLNITSELARLLGYFVSEGNYNFRRKNRKHPTYSVAFTNNSEDLREEIERCVKELLPDVHVYRTSKSRNQLSMHSFLLYVLLKYIFGIPHGAGNKQLPKYVFNFTVQNKYEFLSALFDGDGHVGRDGVYYTTSSEMLKAQLGYFLLSMGYPVLYSTNNNRKFAPTQKKPSKKAEYYIYISGKENQEKMAKMLNNPCGENNKVGKRELLAHEIHYDRMVQIPNDLEKLYNVNDVTEFEITNVEKREYEGMVYDFSVPPCRTFVAGSFPIIIHNCTNERGFVVKEVYDDFIGVNGHSMRSKKSENTNFAFLVRVELTEPLENTTEYGRSIAKLATTIGGAKPIIQRIGDLRRGRRSNPERIGRNLVENTLKDVTPGDISMALPHRIMMDIIEGLEKLDEIIPGVASDSTLLYAPEIKFYARKIKVGGGSADDKGKCNMETSISNLFAAGDGAGLSRDIINAASTGVLAARSIIKKMFK